MKLFDILPPNFFNILTSKNRQLYIDALFLLQDSFSAEELIIRRDDFAARLREKLSSELNSSDFDEDEEIDGITRDSSDLIADQASFIIRKLNKCGWVVVDRIDNKFDYQVYITDYASDILNTLRSLTEEKTDDLKMKVRASYALLKQANDPMDRVDALEAARDNFRSFEKELIKIFTNMKRYHDQSARIENVNDLLTAFLKNYQENIDRKYISPLSKSNSVERFRVEIKSILSSWYIADDMAYIVRSWAEKHKESDSTLSEEDALLKAEEDINHAIIYIESSLDIKLPNLVEKIKEKDSSYKERTIARIKNKSRSGKNIKKALIDLIKISATDDELLDKMSTSFDLSTISIYDKHSLYERKESIRESTDEELRIERGRRDSEALTLFSEGLRSLVSNDEIDSFVLKALRDKSSISTEDFPIESTRDFMLFILSTIRAGEKDAPYSIMRGEGSVVVNGALLPESTFRRRENVRSI